MTEQFKKKNGRGGRNSSKRRNRRGRGGRNNSQKGFLKTIKKSSSQEQFERLTAIYPEERIRLEISSKETIGRFLDIITPIGKGQRALIVAPPRTGKTTILKTISKAISQNHPDIYQIVLLVDERPEEVTDFQREVKAKVVASSADQNAKHHIQCIRQVMEEVRTLTLEGKDSVILMDSITRMSRAYNQAVDSQSKTLSGGLGANAMQEPRQFFGMARNIQEGGSLTIIATALIETGSKMDEVIFQEFKGTGNMELVLNRQLSDRRFFPAIHIQESGTRREDLLFAPEEIEGVYKLRRLMADYSPEDAWKKLSQMIKDTKDNHRLLEII